MQPANRLLLIVVILASAAPVHAQMSGTVGVGAGITLVRPRSPELSTAARVRPNLRRMPSRGWGLAVALNWFDADVDAGTAGASGRLGRLAVRPLMLGIGFTAVRGRFGIAPSLVAGPALNTLVVDDRWEGVFSPAGTRFEQRVGTVSVALRPGVSATYAIAPRFGVTGFAGYLVNRPGITMSTPAGPRRLTWNTDGVVLNAGVLVSLF